MNIWRTGIILAFIVAAGVLAFQIGKRLSDEQIMTVVGVSCGIMASIPVSIGLLIALARERDDRQYAAEPTRADYAQNATQEMWNAIAARDRVARNDGQWTVIKPEASNLAHPKQLESGK